MKDFLLGTIAGAVVCIVGAAAISMFKAPSAQIAQLAPVSPKLANTKKEERKCEKVQAHKAPAKENLKLPEQIQKDDQAVVLTAAPVPPSDYPRTATTLLHLDTGIGEIYLRDDPLPWINVATRYTLGMAYGIKSDATGFVPRLYGKAELVQLKALHLGLLGDVDNTGGWYGGAFVEARW